MVIMHSAIQMWWYTRVLGYRIELTKRLPKQAFAGSIRYASEWVLGPRE